MSSGFPDRHSFILLVMAGYFGLVPERYVLARSPPSGVAKGVMSSLIGAYCAMIGISGGSSATPC